MLGLMDWRVRLELRDPFIFNEKGQIDWNGEAKRAIIIVRQGDPDIEVALVHELLKEPPWRPYRHQRSVARERSSLFTTAFR